jgi:hypothetical protein
MYFFSLQKPILWEFPLPFSAKYPQLAGLFEWALALQKTAMALSPSVFTVDAEHVEKPNDFWPI